MLYLSVTEIYIYVKHITHALRAIFTIFTAGFKAGTSSEHSKLNCFPQLRCSTIRFVIYTMIYIADLHSCKYLKNYKVYQMRYVLTHCENVKTNFLYLYKNRKQIVSSVNEVYMFNYVFIINLFFPLRQNNFQCIRHVHFSQYFMCHKCIVLVQKDKLLLPRSRFAEQFAFHKQRQY